MGFFGRNFWLFIGNYFGKKNSSSWKEQAKTLESDLKATKKSEKKALKDMSKFKVQADNWRSKHEELSQQSQTEIESLKSQTEGFNNKIFELETANSKFESDRRILDSENERVAKKLENLKFSIAWKNSFIIL